METERGISYPIGYTLHPPAAPADIAKLQQDSEPNWIGWQYPWFPASNLKASTHFRHFSPTAGSPDPSLMDYWLTPSSLADTFTTEMLGSIADIWMSPTENYRPGSINNSVRLAARAIHARDDPVAAAAFSVGDIENAHPTLSMTLDVKKKLPEGGVKWLFLRARSLEIKNGRMDVEVTILDEKFELVALSHHVALITPIAGRLYREAKNSDGTGSKL